MPKKKTSENKDVRATYLIPEDIKTELDAIADEQDTSASRVLRQILKGWYKGRKNPNLESTEFQEQ